MPKRRRRFLIAVVLAIIASVWGFVVHPFLAIAASYSATVGAMQHFATGDSLDTIQKERLPSKIGFVKLEVDEASRCVSARALYVTRRAWFRDRLGASRTDEEFSVPDLVATPDPNLLWPEGSSPEASPIPDYVDSTRLFTALTDAFSEEKGTHAVAIVYEGQLIVERYSGSYDRKTPFLGWSMTKSVTATLLGRLVHQGRVNLDAPVPIPEWESDARSEIRLEDLLRMRSGLTFYQNHSSPFSDSLRMLFVDEDCSARPVANPLKHEVASHWAYSDGTSNILARIILDVCSETSDDRLRVPQELLFDPLGMDTAFIAVDASGTFVGSSLMFASARDWARFGLLCARDGVWEGERLLPEGWIDMCAEATSNSTDRSYGAHFWRFDDGPDAGVFSAQGFQGQYIFIDRKRDVVLVRLGVEPVPFNERAFATAVLGAFP